MNIALLGTVSFLTLVYQLAVMQEAAQIWPVNKMNPLAIKKMLKSFKKSADHRISLHFFIASYLPEELVLLFTGDCLTHVNY